MQNAKFKINYNHRGIFDIFLGGILYPEPLFEFSSYS